MVLLSTRYISLVSTRCVRQVGPAAGHTLATPPADTRRNSDGGALLSPGGDITDFSLNSKQSLKERL